MKNIRQLQKHQIDQQINIKCNYLLVGNDPFTLDLYHFLVNEKKISDVKILSEKPLDKNSCLLRGPSGLRGEHNIERFKQIIPGIDLSELSDEPVFVKELKFRKFSGRSKPEPFIFDEEYYLTRCHQYNQKDLFPFLNDDTFFENLSDDVIVSPIIGINYEEEEKQWKIKTRSKHEICSESLIWGNDPYFFMNGFQDKVNLGEEFIELCDSLKGGSALVVRYVFPKVIYNSNETIFIPLSYTHEMGHFVGEFKTNGDEQSIEFIHALAPEESSEEEISKKIRMLRRAIEKMFPEIKPLGDEAFIGIINGTPALKVNDNSYQLLKNKFDTLFFIGMNSPIDNSIYDTEVNHITRGMISLKQIKSTISSL